MKKWLLPVLLLCASAGQAQTWSRDYLYKCANADANIRVNIYDVPRDVRTHMEIIFASAGRVVRGQTVETHDHFPGTRLSLFLSKYEFSTLDKPIQPGPVPGRPIVLSRLRWDGRTLPLRCVYYGWY